VAASLSGIRPESPSDLPQTHPWDEVKLDLSTWATARREQEAVTPRVPGPPSPSAESVRSLEGNRGVTLPASGPSAVSLFWWTLLILVICGIMLGFIKEGPNGLVFGLIIIVMVLPGLQLGAAIVAALIMAVSNRPDKSYQLRQIGKIVLGVMVGAGAGILALVVLFFLFAR
jgi:hypothetical protein